MKVLVSTVFSMLLLASSAIAVEANSNANEIVENRTCPAWKCRD